MAGYAGFLDFGIPSSRRLFSGVAERTKCGESVKENAERMGMVAWEEAVDILVLHRRPKARDQTFFRETCSEYGPNLDIRNRPNRDCFRDVTHLTP